MLGLVECSRVSVVVKKSQVMVSDTWEKKDSECGTIFKSLNIVGVLTPDVLSHREPELVGPVKGKKSLGCPHPPNDWWLSCPGSSMLFASAASP